MPKCPTCGGSLDWIVIDNEQLGTSSRVPDDCPRCVMKRALLYAEAVSVVCPDCGAGITNQQGSEMWLREDVTAHIDSVMRCPSCDVQLRMPTNTNKVNF